MRWVHTYRVNGACFWLLRFPYACPWYWRKLFLLRGAVRSRFGWRIGDGQNTFLWHDQWHPLDVFIDRFSCQLLRQLGISIMAKVSNFIEDGSWIWPDNSYPSSDLILNHLPSLPHLQCCDVSYWLLASNKVFLVKAIF